MRVLEQTTLQVIQHLPAGVQQLDALPAQARSDGYLQVVHRQELLAAARRFHVNVQVHPRPGCHVFAGTTLA
jgi:uncharacterized membrane protein